MAEVANRRRAADTLRWLTATMLLAWGCAGDAVDPPGADTTVAERDAVVDAQDVGDSDTAPDAADSDSGTGDVSAGDTATTEPACAPSVSGWTASAGTWANVQFPADQQVADGAVAEAIYGQLWLDGQTNADGPAAGVSAELLIGPLGTLPGEVCWQSVDAAFNVNVGNNDEYVATPPVSPGLYGLLYRFDLDDGRQVFGDVSGVGGGDGSSGDTITRDAVATLSVPAPSSTVTLATLNIRCQADDWANRRPLVEAALSEVDADVIALQEDCGQATGLQTAVAIAREAGYALVTATTHLAEHDGDVFDEGIALLSRHAIGDVTVLDLSTTHFPRKAIAAELLFANRPALRVYATHYDFGSGSADARLASSNALLADMANYPDADVAVLGDLNAAPETAAVTALTDILNDTWAVANPGVSGATIPSDAPNRRIDYVLTSPSLGTVTTAKLISNSAAGVFLSDHLGVVATIARP